MGKLEIKCILRNFMLKLSKVGFERMLPWQRLNWNWFNQHTIIVFLDTFYEKSLNFVEVEVFVAKIRIFFKK